MLVTFRPPKVNITLSNTLTNCISAEIINLFSKKFSLDTILGYFLKILSLQNNSLSCSQYLFSPSKWLIFKKFPHRNHWRNYFTLDLSNMKCQHVSLLQQQSTFSSVNDTPHSRLQCPATLTSSLTGSDMS